MRGSVEPVPITPFHFGPGMLLGVAVEDSLVAFVVTNVAIDVESGYHLLTHAYPIHTFLHTLVGATLAAVVVMLAVGAATRAVRRGVLSRRTIAGIDIGAVVGAWSHVALDAVMHADVEPLAPWSPANPLRGVLPLSVLHLACVACAMLAGSVFLWKRARGTR